MACKVLFQEISYTELKLRHSSFTCMGCCIVNITIQSLTRYLTFKSGLLDILIIWNNKLELCVGGNNEMYSSNPRRVGIYKSYTWASIHMGSIYTNTPPRSLNYRHNGVQDWTTRKPTPPQSELPAQRCSRLDKKRVQIEYKGKISPHSHN